MSVENERYTGRVKWFNNKAGYGFVTVTDGLKSGTDVFVHHSAIQVDSEQYKYLVQGEYIEFSMIHASEQHEYQAGNVSGIKGGKLMCETRRESRVARSQYRNESSTTTNDTSTRVANGRSVEGGRVASRRRETSGRRAVSVAGGRGTNEGRAVSVAKGRGRVASGGRGQPPV
jgi:CspA family cold shock protein